MAHVQPVDGKCKRSACSKRKKNKCANTGTSRWSDAAKACFSQQCASRIVQIELVGYHKDSNIPFVEVYAPDEHKQVDACSGGIRVDALANVATLQVRRIDAVLRELGFAKPADPSRIVPAPPTNKSSHTKAEPSNKR